jgi:hypothetical protein
MSRASPAPRTAGTFGAEEWRLLIRLPAEVMIAAIGAQGDGGRRTVAEGLAGLDAIAAGRNSDSELVRAVVTAIYSEPEDDGGLAQDADPGGMEQVLEHCRRAAEVLRVGADPADAGAYREWVQLVAAQVCDASRSGGVLGLSGERIDGDTQELLDELAAALS